MKSHRPHLPLVKKRLTQIQCVCDENNLNYGLISDFEICTFVDKGGTKQWKWIGEKKNAPEERSDAFSCLNG